MTTATAIETTADLERQVSAAAAEVADLEKQADTAPAAELGRLSAAIGAARAMLDVVGRRHRLAIARQQAEQTARSQASLAASHARQLADLKARLAACADGWQEWGEDAEAIEASVAELWQRYHALQTEVRAIAEEDVRLAANLPPPALTAEAGAFIQRARASGHAVGVPTGGIRFGTVSKQGVSY